MPSMILGKNHGSLSVIIAWSCKAFHSSKCHGILAELKNLLSNFVAGAKRREIIGPSLKNKCMVTSQLNLVGFRHYTPRLRRLNPQPPHTTPRCVCGSWRPHRTSGTDCRTHTSCHSAWWGQWTPPSGGSPALWIPRCRKWDHCRGQLQRLTSHISFRCI